MAELVQKRPGRFALVVVEGPHELERRRRLRLIERDAARAAAGSGCGRATLRSPLEPIPCASLWDRSLWGLTAWSSKHIVLNMKGKAERDEEERALHARALSQLGASKGGLARAAVLSAVQRREIARRAAAARWRKEVKES